MPTTRCAGFAKQEGKDRFETTGGIDDVFAQSVVLIPEVPPGFYIYGRCLVITLVGRDGQRVSVMIAAQHMGV